MARKVAIIVFAIVVLVGASLVLVSTIQSRYTVLRAYTDDAGGLNEGTSVRLNGIPVGYLDHLLLTDSRDPKRKIEVLMKVQRRFLGDIPQDSLVSVAATNLLGNYYLDIIRGHSSVAVAENGELQTSAAIDPQRLLAQIGNELQEISGIFDRFGKLVAEVPQGHGNIGKWTVEGLNQFDRLSANYNEFLKSLQSSQGNLKKVDEVTAELNTSQARLNDLLAAMRNGQGTVGNLDKAVSQLHDLTAETNKLTAAINSAQGPGARLKQIGDRFDVLAQHVQLATDRVNSGQGTLGQLEVNPQLSTAIAQTGAAFQDLAKGVRQNPKKFLSFSFHLF